MTRVFRSPAAERDMEEIWLTIAADNPLRRDTGRARHRRTD